MFCTNCRAQVTGAFCAACGQRAGQTAPTPAQPSPASAAPGAAAKGGSLGKVLLVVFGCFVLFGALATAGIYYAASRLKAKALQTISGATGVTLGDAGKPRLAVKNVCAVLPKEDVEQVLGIQIEKTAEITDAGESGCAFFTSPEAFKKLTGDSLAQVRKEAEADAAKAEAGAARPEKPGRGADNPLALLNTESLKKLEGIVKTAAIEGQAQQGDGRVFSFTVDPSFGRDSWPTFRATFAIIPGFEPISGVGDNAMIGPFGHVLHVQKGGTKVTLNLMAVPDARNKGVALARQIVARL